MHILSTDILSQIFFLILGNKITFMNWLPGRKDTFFHGNEDCVYMSPHYNGQWEDVECGGGFFGSGHRYTCQYSKITFFDKGLYINRKKYSCQLCHNYSKGNRFSYLCDLKSYISFLFL